MWIRSQEKDRLIKCEHFGFHQESKNCNVIWGNESCLWLGVYSTKEKALKVLDDIEMYMFNHGTLGLSYQMPQDSEVE